MEDYIYVKEISSGIRGVFCKKAIPCGIIVTIYPHSNEMKSSDWMNLKMNDERIKKCANYILERYIGPHKRISSKTGKEISAKEGKYILYPDVETPFPPYGHLLNHCTAHPNLKASN